MPANSATGAGGVEIYWALSPSNAHLFMPPPHKDGHEMHPKQRKKKMLAAIVNTEEQREVNQRQVKLLRGATQHENISRRWKAATRFPILEAKSVGLPGRKRRFVNEAYFFFAAAISSELEQRFVSAAAITERIDGLHARNDKLKKEKSPMRSGATPTSNNDEFPSNSDTTRAQSRAASTTPLRDNSDDDLDATRSGSTRHGPISERRLGISVLKLPFRRHFATPWRKMDSKCDEIGMRWDSVSRFCSVCDHRASLVAHGVRCSLPPARCWFRFSSRRVQFPAVLSLGFLWGLSSCALGLVSSRRTSTCPRHFSDPACTQ